MNDMAEVIVDGVRYVPAPPVLTDDKLLAALEVRFDSDAGDQLTLRQFLHQLLDALWVEGEGFSGKRPWGNSGWQYGVLDALARAGHIEGAVVLEPNGDPREWVDLTPQQEQAGNDLVRQLLAAAFFGVNPTT